jgi:hypothetical protein
MTGNATVLTRGNAAARTRENREYVRSLLKVRQPQFAAALESATRELLRDHRNGRRLVGEEYLMTDGSVMTSSATTGSAGASREPFAPRPLPAAGTYPWRPGPLAWPFAVVSSPGHAATRGRPMPPSPAWRRPSSR